MFVLFGIFHCCQQLHGTSWYYDGSEQLEVAFVLSPATEKAWKDYQDRVAEGEIQDGFTIMTIWLSTKVPNNKSFKNWKSTKLLEPSSILTRRIPLGLQRVEFRG